MSKMNQKDAVYQAVMNVVGNQDGAYVLSKDEKANVCQIIVEGFKLGRIELEKEFDEKQIKAYVPGLVSNWLRKDKRLNGGTKHVIKNPGSRFGSTDKQLKALKALYNSESDDDKRAEIQTFIDRRTSELSAEKPRTVTVNLADLPAELQAKYSQAS
jgi:hypothetical protein